MKQTSPPNPPQPWPAENTRNVLSGPAPRSVTLFLLLKMTPVERLYVPACRNTTCPLGHAAIALLICAAVAPGPSVVQIVVRFGMPPGTPALRQSMLRVAATVVCCANAAVDRLRSKKHDDNNCRVTTIYTVATSIPAAGTVARPAILAKRTLRRSEPARG